MSISLGEAIGQAQAAFDNGDYRSVVESCSRIVDQYPHYAGAQRLLGQAYLEQGQPGEAESWFSRLLAHDPREASAYLGLGLIAEDRGILDHALAYCQVAWELAPEQARYRETVTRVAEKRYGQDGRLRLTHAALAKIHAGSWRLRRAIKEYQSALIALPDRVDLWMGLAEVLWLLGEDSDAAEIAREFLKEHTELIPALVILADIERRMDNQDEALKYRDRLRRIDPDSSLTLEMVKRNRAADIEFFMLKDEEQPTVVERVDAVVSERPQFAPAPDFTFQPQSDEQIDHSTDLDDLVPIRLEEFTDEFAPADTLEPTTSSFVPESLGEEEPDTVEVEPIEADELIEDTGELIEYDIDDDLSQIEDELVSEGLPTPPEDPADAPTGHDLEAELLDLAGELEPFEAEEDDAGMMTAQTAPDDADELMEDLEGIEPMSLDEFGAGDEGFVPMAPGFFDDAEIDFDIRVEDPDAVQIGGGPPAVAPGIFSSGGNLVNAPGLDSDDFPELPEVDELFDDIDEDSQETVLLDESDLAASGESEPAAMSEPAAEPSPATPAPPEPNITHIPSGTGFTRLLGELGNEGLAPFDPIRPSDAGSAAPDAAGASDNTISSLADGWDDIDAELASATPGGEEAFDELIDIDELGLQPFTLDDEDMDYVTAVHPAGPANNRFPAVQPIAEIPDENVQAAGPQTPVEAPEEATKAVDFEDVPGLEPFAIEDFDEMETDAPFEFGVLPWERQGDGASGLDIDIDGLLGEPPAADLPPAGPMPEAEPVPDIDYDNDLLDDPSMEITRELGSGTIDPNFAHRMAEVEAAARRNLDRMQQEHGVDPVEPVQAADVGANAGELPDSDILAQPTAERIVADEQIFLRSRSAKDALVDQGVIRGNRELEGVPAAVELEPEPIPEPEPVEESPEVPEPFEFASPVAQAEDEVDIDDLRSRLEHNPHDDSARWQLAEALRNRGEVHAAFTEYRWLIRHSPGRHNAVIDSLEVCAQAGLEADLAHRLLADIYRRRGDSAQARNHASMAMATRRLMREVRM